MIGANVILMFIALVFLLLAGLNASVSSRVNLGWLGMFFWLLAILLRG